MIGSDNGLSPTRRQAIIWTNDGQFIDAYMRHSASMSSFPITTHDAYFIRCRQWEHMAIKSLMYLIQITAYKFDISIRNMSQSVHWIPT